MSFFIKKHLSYATLYLSLISANIYIFGHPSNQIPIEINISLHLPKFLPQPLTKGWREIHKVKQNSFFMECFF